MKSVAARPQYAPPPDEFARLVLEAIRRYDLERRTTVQSFDYRMLAARHRLAPNIRLSALADRGDRRPFTDIAREACAKVIAPHYTLVTPEKVEATHASGLQVWPWTPNAPKD